MKRIGSRDIDTYHDGSQLAFYGIVVPVHIIL
jgi:hypothetical protein